MLKNKVFITVLLQYMVIIIKIVCKIAVIYVSPRATVGGVFALKAHCSSVPPFAKYGRAHRCLNEILHVNSEKFAPLLGFIEYLDGSLTKA